MFCLKAIKFCWIFNFHTFSIHLLQTCKKQPLIEEQLFLKQRTICLINAFDLATQLSKLLGGRPCPLLPMAKSCTMFKSSLPRLSFIRRAFCSFQVTIQSFHLLSYQTCPKSCLFVIQAHTVDSSLQKWSEQSKRNWQLSVPVCSTFAVHCQPSGPE